MATTVGVINPYRYRGYRYDTETGLYYLQSRYYDPATGRFINADNQVSAGSDITGLNLFAYCGNNPVNYLDYDGHNEEAVFEAWTATAWWLSLIDGPLPIGDIIYAIGIIVLGTIAIFTTLTIADSSINFETSKEVENTPAPPAVEYPGDDGSKSPGDDFEWKGQEPAGGDKGSWVNDSTGEQLHPDLNHEPPIGPHWDYQDPYSNKWRLFPDNTFELK